MLDLMTSVLPALPMMLPMVFRASMAPTALPLSLVTMNLLPYFFSMAIFKSLAKGPCMQMMLAGL